MKRLIRKIGQRKLVAFLSALLFGIIIVGAPQTAQAAGATTYDNFGGWYYSSGSGNAAASNWQSGNTITWHSGNNIVVQAELHDLKGDGRAPTLVVQLTYFTAGGNYWDGSTTVELRDTISEYAVAAKHTFKWPTNGDHPRLSFTVCNGKSSSGLNEQCGSTHTFNP